MSATRAAPLRDTNATQVRLNFAIIDSWAKRNKLLTAQAVADEFEIDRRTLLRHKSGEVEPTLAAAVKIAARMGVTLDDRIVPPGTAPRQVA